MKLYVATHNAHKIREIAAILEGFDVTPDDPEGVIEDAPDFAGNALIKVRAIAARHAGAWCLADDSGLEVRALNGAPGVRSARYAGEPSDTPRNNALLLRNLEGVRDRTANFTCAIALVAPDGTEHVVTGRCFGRIAETPSGTEGFGYDPLFIPEGHAQSFAALPPSVKNTLSHRARALAEAKAVMGSRARGIPQIVELASAFYGSAVLFAAIDTGVFAAVERASRLDDIAAALCPPNGADLRATRILLDACVAEGLLEKTDEGYFNTPAGRRALVPGAPADLTKAIRYNRDVYPAWGCLAQFVATGECVERPALHLGADPARTQTFAAAMFGRAMGIGRSVIPMLGTLEGRILDLAGGPAAYAIQMCQANPRTTCVTVDLPEISKVAEGYVAQFGLADRITCRTGDYHTDEYEGATYDVVTIFGALHQESPESIGDILRRAAHALKPGGRVIVLDMMTDATHANPPFSALFAVNMALTTRNGWVFSDTELKDWMREAGLTPGKTQTVPPPMPHWIVTAVK